MNTRRIFIIALAALILIAVAIGVYFLFFAPKGPGVTVGEPTDPFGSAGEYVGGGEAPAVGAAISGAGDELAPHLIRITEGPVVRGSAAINITEIIQTPPVIDPVTGSTTAATSTETITDTEVRYLERESGNVYAFRLNARTLTRLSNRTLPGIYDAAWLSDGSRAFVRFLSEGGRIDTYSLPAEGEGGYFLEPGLEPVAVTGTSTILTVLPSSTGSIGSVSKPDGSGLKTLFTSSLAAMRVLPSGNSYAAYTKASAEQDGYGFLISGAGVFEPVLGPRRGLTLLPSPTGAKILYSYVLGNTARTELLDVATGAITELPVGTLSEKCVWAPNESAVYCAVPRTLTAGVPDTWYQGAVSFSDRLWKIDLAGRVAALVADPNSLANVSIDAVNLAVDRNEDALVFTDKKTGALWLYDL